MSFQYAIGSFVTANAGNGTVLALPQLPVAAVPGDLVVVGFANAYNGVGPVFISAADDIVGPYSQDAGQIDPDGSSQTTIFSHVGVTGQPIITITLSTARTFRYGYAALFRNTKGPISIGTALGGIYNGFAPFTVVATSVNTANARNGIAVVVARTNRDLGPGADWSKIGEGHYNSDTFEWRAFSDQDHFPVLAECLGTGIGYVAVSGVEYFGDSEALQWGSVSGARILTYRGGGPN